jgi:hypothetical protein
MVVDALVVGQGSHANAKPLCRTPLTPRYASLSGRAGEKTIADLSGKAVQCLFENAVLLETGGVIGASLNRSLA